MASGIVLIAVIAACIVFRNVWKDYPWVMYAVALLLDVAFWLSNVVEFPHAIWSVLFVLVQRCTLGVWLLMVVMGIGALPRTSKLSLWLRPIRAELSITGCIASLGHVVWYIASYIPRLSIEGVKPQVLVGFLIALVITVLLVVLGVTSFSFVKQRMNAARWKQIQLAAYPFIGLVFVHICVLLAPAALSGGQAAFQSLVLYGVVFGIYLIARVIVGVDSMRKKASEV